MGGAIVIIVQCTTCTLLITSLLTGARSSVLHVHILVTNNQFVNWSVLHVHGDRKNNTQVLISIGLLSMRQNMIHDYHGGRERSIGIMVCTKVKGHTQNLFSWSLLPCESLAQESTPNPITLASFPGNKKHQL